MPIKAPVNNQRDRPNFAMKIPTRALKPWDKSPGPQPPGVWWISPVSGETMMTCARCGHAQVIAADGEPKRCLFGCQLNEYVVLEPEEGDESCTMPKDES